MATITATRAVATTPGEIRWFPLAASQTFLKGEFVYLDINGRLTACAADPTATGIAGIAEASCADIKKANGSTTTLGYACPITIAKRGQQFTLNITNAGTNNAVTAISQVGRQYSLYVASNVHYCDVGDTSNKIFVVDSIAEDNVLGDTGGRVIVEVRSTYATLDSATS